MTRKISAVIGRVAAGLAALSMVVSASAASADSRGHHHYDRRGDHDRGGDIASAAIVAGVIGLAIGAAISGDDHDRYDRPQRPRVYAPPPPPPPRYGYAPRPYYDDYDRDCWTTRDYDRRSGVVYEHTVCR